MATLAALPIALVSLNGPRTFGPAAIPQSVTWARLSLDRTAGAQSLNSQPDTTQIAFLVEVSIDGGATWHPEIQATTIGGALLDSHGSPVNASVIQVQPIAGDSNSTTRQARAAITPTAPVSISGTLELGN